jgi:hypothetical protein
MRDVLVRYSGTLDEWDQDSRKDLKNPIVWFREGVRTVIAIPFRFLKFLGILSRR